MSKYKYNQVKKDNNMKAIIAIWTLAFFAGVGTILYINNEIGKMVVYQEVGNVSIRRQQTDLTVDNSKKDYIVNNVQVQETAQVQSTARVQVTAGVEQLRGR